MRVKLWLLTLGAAALHPGATAAAQVPDSLFPARPSGYVTDVAGLLPPAAVEGIRAQVARIKDSTRVEVAVVILPTLADRAPVDLAVAIGRKWGVGALGEIGDATRNAGAVLLVVPRGPGSPDKRHCFIATSAMLQGYLTDLESTHLCQALNAAGKAGDYPGGIAAAVEGIGVQAAKLAAEGPRKKKEMPGWVKLTIAGVILLAIVFMVGLIVWAIAAARRAEAAAAAARAADWAAQGRSAAEILALEAAWQEAERERRRAAAASSSWSSSSDSGSSSGSDSFSGGGSYDGGGGGSSSD